MIKLLSYTLLFARALRLRVSFKLSADPPMAAAIKRPS